MKKLLLLLLLTLSFIGSAYAEIKGTDMTGRSDSFICSWFDVVPVPKIYIDEAKKRKLTCDGKSILIPNSYPSGNSFRCYSGYKKSGNSCIKVVPPANAYISGNSWICKSGYQRSGNICVKKLYIPLNAYASGDNSWSCYSGFKKSGNSCIKVVPPANAYISGNSWTCNSGYQRSGNTCIKKTVINNTSSSYKTTSPSRVNNKNSDWSILWIIVGVFLIFKLLFRKKTIEPAPKPKPIVVAKKEEKVIITKPAPKPKPANASLKQAKVVIPKPKNKIPSKPIKVPTSHFAPGSTKGFKIINLEQGSKDWLKWRHEGIGASNAPTIMGDNRFESPEELLYQKKNKIDTVPNEKMKLGIKLEPKARELYIKETGIKVKPQCVQDNKFPWLIASMDGISDDLKHIIEIKCGQSAYWQARRGIVPDYYYGQLQHTMMITRLYQIDYWCYWPGERGILQTVDRDDSYIKSLFKTEQAFQKRLESE